MCNDYIFLLCPYWYNVYVFIPMVLFIVKNYQKWVHMGMGGF